MTNKATKQHEKLEKIKSSWRIKEGNGKKCTSCFAQINDNAKKCHNCQKRLGAVGVFQELQAPLSVIVALLSILIVMYDKVESSKLFNPPKSEISVSPITWDFEKFYAVIVNEGERPGWILSSSMSITIEVSDDENAMLHYQLVPSVDLIQPSDSNNLEQLELIPTNMLLPGYWTSQASSLPSNMNDFKSSFRSETNSTQPEALPEASPETPSDNEAVKSTADEYEFSSYDEERFNRIRKLHSESIISALSIAIRDHSKIKECSINLTIKNFNGSTTSLSQNALLPSVNNQNSLQITSSSIIRGSDNCSQFLSSSLSKIDNDIYLEVVFDGIFESIKIE